MKQRIVCSECGSKNVLFDAWAWWDEDKQTFVLDEVFDYCFCADCDSETKPEHIDITEEGNGSVNV